jgi:hypothetical protein
MERIARKENELIQGISRTEKELRGIERNPT